MKFIVTITQKDIFFNKLPLLSILLLCIVVVVFSVKMALANLYSYGLKNWHQSWQDDYAATLTTDNIAVANSVMRGMLANEPTHAFYLTLAAKQIEWQYFYQQQSKETEHVTDIANLQQVADLYLLAAKLRPSWPNTYVDLAKNSWQRGDDIHKQMHYLELAKTVAPYAQTTVLAFIHLGLSQWPLLDQQQRADVARYTVLAMQTPGVNYKAAALLKDPLINQLGCNLLAFVRVQSHVCKR